MATKEQEQQSSTSKSVFVDTHPKPVGSLHEDGSPMLNRYSAVLTNGYDYPGAQAMLYGAGIKNEFDLRRKAQVGKFQLLLSFEYLEPH